MTGGKTGTRRTGLPGEDVAILTVGTDVTTRVGRNWATLGLVLVLGLVRDVDARLDAGERRRSASSERHA
jgi:hypothetical protein